MSRKSKGINAERDLIHKFWAVENWTAIRIAGSGSNKYPSADILAANRLRKLAIECKTTKDKKKYFTNEEIEQFRFFAERFGAEPWIAMKFNKEDWFFLAIEDIEKSGKCYAISLENARKKGLLFEEIIKT